ncbi:hypothetical protein CLAIMM_06179 [Cladophialophora immunda]|nr:hypothetical protein CLAIMM_06179 [Cladophialophora immunda]
MYQICVDICYGCYAALSYCWGESGIQRTIHINGARKSVSANLYFILQRLRKGLFKCACRSCICHQKVANPGRLDICFTQPGSLLWIDAICIDQTNNDEKNQQIPLMKDIFKGSGMNIFWVGEEDEDTQKTFEFLHAVAELGEMPEEQAISLLSYAVSREYFGEVWKSLGEFFCRPWWTRLWVVQEVVLSKEAILICGSWGIDWEVFHKCARLLKAIRPMINELQEATVLDETFSYFNTFMWGLSNLVIFTSLTSDLSRRAKVGTSDLAQDSEMLHSLLRMSRDYSVSDERDKVYGMLGIYQELGASLKVDINYDETVSNLYMRMVALILQGTWRLDFLGDLERRRDWRQARKWGLPSWVPDWTARSNLRSITGDGQDLQVWLAEKSKRGTTTFTFTGTSRAEYDINFTGKTLRVKGFVFDTIEGTAQRLFDLNETAARAISRNSTTFRRRICGPKIPYEHEDQSRDFWDLRLGDIGSEAESQALSNDEKNSDISHHGEDANASRLELVCFSYEIRGL